MTTVVLVALAASSAADEEEVLVALVDEIVPELDEELLDVDVAADELDDDVVVVLPVALVARPAKGLAK